MATPEINARKMIRDLQYHAGSYAKYALEARKKYLELRMKQDTQIQWVYQRSIKKITKELRELSSIGANPLRVKQLLQIEQAIAREFAKLNGDVDELVKSYIKDGVTAGISYSQVITLDALSKVGMSKTPMMKTYSRINTRAAEAIYARTHKGLTTADRIWQNSQRASDAIKHIVQEAVVVGSDVVEVASMLEKYVRNDSKTITLQYPNMMKRIKSRVPTRLSYEALRLARTEMTAAFGEGVIQAGRVSPSSQGVKWVLSPSHPMTDICDTFANADVGLGKGVYPKGEEPRFPPHPNCLCSLLPVHEEPEDFVTRLRDWMNKPSNQPDLEDWYQNVYRAS